MGSALAQDGADKTINPRTGSRLTAGNEKQVIRGLNRSQVVEQSRSTTRWPHQSNFTPTALVSPAFTVTPAVFLPFSG